MLKFKYAILLFSIFFLGLVHASNQNKKDRDPNDVSFLKFINQTGYKIVHYRVEQGTYNKTYLRFFNTVYYHYNRTARAFNQTFTPNKDLSELKIHVQVYKFLSNEYRYFPITLQFDLCSALKQNIGGLGEVRRCGNYLSTCTYLKGHTYTACNWVPDVTKFPPLIPPGEYKADLTVKVRDSFLTIYSWYGAIVEIMPRD